VDDDDDDGDGDDDDDDDGDDGVFFVFVVGLRSKKFEIPLAVETSPWSVYIDVLRPAEARIPYLRSPRALTPRYISTVIVIRLKKDKSFFRGNLKKKS